MNRAELLRLRKICNDAIEENKDFARTGESNWKVSDLWYDTFNAESMIKILNLLLHLEMQVQMFGEQLDKIEMEPTP